MALFTPVLLGSLPSRFFLAAFVVLGLNLASSPGDVLQAQAFLRLPGGVLVRDDGRQTSVHDPTERREQESCEPASTSSVQDREVRRER